MCQASSCIPPHQPLRVSSQRTQLNGEIRIRGPSLSSAGPSTGLSDLAPKKKNKFYDQMRLQAPTELQWHEKIYFLLQ